LVVRALHFWIAGRFSNFRVILPSVIDFVFITTHAIGFEKENSPHFVNQSEIMKTNTTIVIRSHTFSASYIYFLQVLIGSSE